LWDPAGLGNFAVMSQGMEELERVARSYGKSIIKGWERMYARKWAYAMNALCRHALPGHALEMGCADGEATRVLAPKFQRLTVLDGSRTFLEQARSAVGAAPHVTFTHGLFEEFAPTDRFQTIFAVHVLEHLDDPVAVLRRARGWLAPGGRFIALVPNAKSLHRAVGVKLGLLAKPDDLNAQDVQLGHRRVYTPELLKAHAVEAGFDVRHFGGIMIKPLSNRQMEEQWGPELVDAFLRLGEDYPEISSEVFVVLEAARSV
jgi:trans-aconitate methyltransferase